MALSVKSLTLLLVVLLTGLSAGFFYAWQVSVIPGTRRVDDMTYLQTMQSVNRAILTPGFFIVFLGCLIVLPVSIVQQYNNGAIFWILLLSLLMYLFGTFGVTALGNVPLNNTLDATKLAGLTNEQAAQLRNSYEMRWNRFHLIRTIFAVLSFLLCAQAMLFRELV